MTPASRASVSARAARASVANRARTAARNPESKPAAYALAQARAYLAAVLADEAEAAARAAREEESRADLARLNGPAL